jgi:hypothetical protein
MQEPEPYRCLGFPTGGPKDRFLSAPVSLSRSYQGLQGALKQSEAIGAAQHTIGSPLWVGHHPQHIPLGVANARNVTDRTIRIAGLRHVAPGVA